jgi:hypothetical protein
MLLFGAENFVDPAQRDRTISDKMGPLEEIIKRALGALRIESAPLSAVRQLATGQLALWSVAQRTEKSAQVPEQ